MSEIYEALRKAQTERKQGTPRPESRREPLPIVLPPPRRRRVSFRERLRGIGRGGRNGSGVERLIIPPGGSGAIAERFRVLRTHAQALGPGTIAVTSALDQEGKTVCATNLAIALSLACEGNAGVILVDTDFRRPS